MAVGMLTQVADGVKTIIEATVTVAGGTTARKYVPDEKLEDLVGLVVSVVPRTETRERQSRGGIWFHDYTVDVAVQKRAATDAEVDDLTGLADTLANLIEDTDPAAPAHVSLLTLKVAGPYWPHLDQKGVFTYLITASYRAARQKT